MSAIAPNLKMGPTSPSVLSVVGLAVAFVVTSAWIGFLGYEVFAWAIRLCSRLLSFFCCLG
jgi:hypothetical protein